MSQVIREVPQHEPYPEGAITLRVLEMQEGVHGVVPEADGQETQGGRVGDSFSELKWIFTDRLAAGGEFREGCSAGTSAHGCRISIFRCGK